MTFLHPRLCALVALAALADAACAATSGVTPAGFLVTHRAEVKAAPAAVVEAIGHPERWWNAEHSYSGQAANLSMGLHAGDCFCERWAGGEVRHATVVMVLRQPAMVRLEGAFGPLQALAVNAVLTFTMKPGGEGGRTVLEATYRVNGNAESGLDKLAGPVDGVIGEQVARLARVVDGGAP